MRIVLGVGLAMLFASLTHQQTAGRWQRDRTLWCDAVRLVPDKPRALNNCAVALIRDGAYPEALPLLDRGLLTVEQREPNRRTALRSALQANRFLVLYALRRADEARTQLAQMDPAYPRTQEFARWLAP